MNSDTKLIPLERIQNSIFLIRGEKVLLDSQLAELYQVPTKTLTQAVKRNADRFPEDFMFQLTPAEVKSLRCQIGISNIGRGGSRYLPHAFTEQGVAMLSSVLRSDRAVQVNVAIMRVFVSLRRLLSTSETLARKFAELERKLEGHDEAIKTLFDAIRELMAPPLKPKRELGFHAIAKDRERQERRRPNARANKLRT